MGVRLNWRSYFTGGSLGEIHVMCRSRENARTEARRQKEQRGWDLVSVGRAQHGVQGNLGPHPVRPGREEHEVYSTCSGKTRKV